MQTELINNNGQNLIVYFAGWGSPVSAVAHLRLPQNYDLLVCYHYQDLALNFDFSNYQQIHLVAWSMGVWVADQVMQDITLTSAIAINGTGKPCDDLLGIPQTVFIGTLENLDETNLAKFQRRICGDKQLFTQYQQLSGQRGVIEDKQELAALYQAMQQPLPNVIKWNKAIIGEQDRIFPLKNQLEYWQQYFVNQQDKIIQIALPHYPFAYFDAWDKLCDF